MSDFNNELTPAEAERLAILTEELGEAQQAVGKILRHGYQSRHPERDEQSNRFDLTDELGDIVHTIRLMAKNEDVSLACIESRVAARDKSLPQYLHHQS